MKQKLQLAIVLFAAVIASCWERPAASEYGYLFIDSTGQNQYLLLGAARIPFMFDETRSDSVALGSLRSLRPEILYGNCEGDKIILVGLFDRQTGTLALEHWFLKAPFTAWVPKDAALIPHELRQERRQVLTRGDFGATASFDPNDPTFEPAAFIRSRP